jgi:hypothetical protein
MLCLVKILTKVYIGEPMLCLVKILTKVYIGEQDSMHIQTKKHHLHKTIVTVSNGKINGKIT